MMELLRFYLIFAGIGLFTIGGGMAMLPLMQKSLVEQGLMSMQETIDMVAVSHMTPGPFAINAATFAGMRFHGIPGAVAATLGVITPSLLLTILVARFFISFHKKPLVGGALGGLRPAVMALILSAALSVGRETLFPAGFATGPDWLVLVLTAASAAVLFGWGKRVNPIWLIVICGAVGGVWQMAMSR